MFRNRAPAFAVLALLVSLNSTAEGPVNSPSQPTLTLRVFNNQSVRLAWPTTANNFLLEATGQLGSGALWQRVIQPPVLGAEDFSVTIVADGVTRFFRLRLFQPDGDDDDDGLINSLESARGTDPFLADTDGDGWSDGVEVADGSDPLDLNSSPRPIFVARPSVDVFLPSFDEIGTTGTGITMGSPGVELVFPNLDEVDSASGVTIGRPSVDLVFPALDEIGATGGLTMGRPPVEIVFPSLDEVDSSSGITLGRPPISIRYVP